MQSNYNRSMLLNWITARGEQAITDPRSNPQDGVETLRATVVVRPDFLITLNPTGAYGKTRQSKYSDHHSDNHPKTWGGLPGLHNMYYQTHCLSVGRALA